MTVTYQNHIEKYCDHANRLSKIRIQLLHSNERENLHTIIFIWEWNAIDCTAFAWLSKLYICSPVYRTTKETFFSPTNLLLTVTLHSIVRQSQEPLAIKRPLDENCTQSDGYWCPVMIIRGQTVTANKHSLPLSKWTKLPVRVSYSRTSVSFALVAKYLSSLDIVIARIRPSEKKKINIFQFLFIGFYLHVVESSMSNDDELYSIFECILVSSL